MKTHGQRGSILITTLGIICLLAIVAFTVVDLSMSTYRLTMRNELRAQARAVAESELEYMLYQFKAVVVSQAAATASDAPAALAAICDNTATPTTVRAPFLTEHANAGWTVRRSMVRENEPFTGTIPGTTKVGTFTYIIARVEVIPPATGPFAGIQTVRVGRRFINSNTSLFQFSIFFQGDLELNPGSGNTIVNGDIVANGSIYLGPRHDASVSTATLQLNGKVRYLAGDFFNTLADGTTASYSNPNGTPPPVTLGPPVGADGITVLTSSSSQVETQSAPENLLGGIDATAEAQSRPDLFGPPNRTDPTVWTAAELSAAENNVYRSLISPPPSASTVNEYPNGDTHTADDDVITVRRAYNRSDLIVTVETNGTVSVAKVVDGTVTDVTSTFASVVTAPPATPNFYDEREAKNISLTQVNVGALKTKLDTLRAATDATHFDFQGLLYVNLKNSSPTSPAAVRLTNGASLPSNATTGAGFSVATNGGLYVQGSYNTDALKDSSGNTIAGVDGTPRAVPAMLMADAITVLSSNWVDNTSGASIPLSTRVAALSTAEAADGNTMKVNAGLLTGNQASDSNGTSGGAQNLVRYLEDWSGKNITFNGSLGRLFSSTQFIGRYANGLITGAGTVYNQPSRTFNFDSNIPTHPPPGNPTSTAFGRGDFFTW